LTTTEQTVIGILVSAALAQEQLDEHLCWLEWNVGCNTDQASLLAAMECS